MKIKSYDRLKRTLDFEVSDKEYSARLTNGMLEEIEKVALSQGKSFVDMFLNKEPATLAMMKKTFCIGLMKDGKAVKGDAAIQVYNEAMYEGGIPEMTNFYYILMATVQAFGAEASKIILTESGLYKDDESVTEKNA